MDSGSPQNPGGSNRLPITEPCIVLRAPDPTVERLARESDRFARQARRDSVPLPDYKLKRGRNRR